MDFHGGRSTPANPPSPFIRIEVILALLMIKVNLFPAPLPRNRANCTIKKDWSHWPDLKRIPLAETARGILSFAYHISPQT